MSKPGFERLFKRLSIEAGRGTTEKITLELGSVEETITVADMGAAGPPPAPRIASAATLMRLRESAPDQHIQPPIKVRDVFPVYPESVRGSGFEGKVVLAAVITAEGFVEVAQILAPVDPESMTTIHPDLARAAVAAVLQWQYEPTRLHGVPVETRMDVSVNFKPGE